MNTVTHPPCQKSWRNINRNSHCPVCHETFSNHAVADAHRQTIEGERVCMFPGDIKVSGWTPILHEGRWRSGKPDRRTHPKH